MEPHFLTADMDGEFLRALTDLFSSHLDSIRQDVAQAFPFSQLLSHRHYCPVVSPPEVDSVRILPGQDTFFVGRSTAICRAILTLISVKGALSFRGRMAVVVPVGTPIVIISGFVFCTAFAC